ncbi:hypothetical protein PV328_011917 [Microctonus aethiopoides]|uniref:Uncharacterized protein n=1 Tax=Microctonus aethiopoides TaxID=144406 RepID=A0AA39C385_9HYME|nr:hypothetical protein PV328_011917 [Microctonus aethiopoides]
MCNLDLNFGIMEVVLETGFEKILHSIEFQPQTVQKGRLLNEVSHVINVKEFRRNGTNCRIEARVIRQTSVNSTSYTIKLIMYPPNKKPNIQPIKTTIDELPEPSPYRTMLLEAAKGNNYYSSKAKIASVQKHQMIENEKIDCQLIIENFFYFKENYDVYCSGSSVGSNCEEYYEKNIILTKCDILKLSSDTLKQSKCDKWYQARNIRLSSSKNIHKIEWKSTKYGLKNEPIAKSRYEEMFKV